MFIDTHAHLNNEQLFDIRQACVNNAKNANVNAIICASSDLITSKKALQICTEFDNMFCTIGFHPDDISQMDVPAENFLLENAKNKKVVAIGEIGLDYHNNISNHAEQKVAFKKQIEIAIKSKKPIVVHTRQSINDTITILEQYKNEKVFGVVHCFAGDISHAKKIMELGYVMSFGGTCTFKNAPEIREVLEQIPLSHILLETDSPFLTPSPFRGKINEPKYIPLIAQQIADIKRVSLEQVEKTTTQNAIRVFGINI
ncbi:MAG: TatD family hydrolase [Clostridia bacterium]